MALTQIEKSLILAAFFRGGSLEQHGWTSNSDQIVTLSLFYTNDIKQADCVDRFSYRSYIQKLYDEHGYLTEEIETRYKILINMLNEHPDLIEGGGDFELPADPTFTACRLTSAGFELAAQLIKGFPLKPEFPDWPDKRAAPDAE